MQPWKLAGATAQLVFLINFVKLEKMKKPESGHITLIQLIYCDA